MELKEAVEALKIYSSLRKVYKLEDRITEAIDTVISHIEAQEGGE